MDAVRNIIRAFGPVRAAAVATALIAAVALIAWMLTRLAEPDLALLYGDLEDTDAARVIGHLESAGIAYELRQNGAAIYVPATAVPRLRVTLAEQGLPTGGSTGYELFDTAPTLGTTNFMQNVNLVRALEGELSRSIRSLDAVQAVRVHLVLPKREMFSRNRDLPSASVLLRLRREARLAPRQVLAIQHLVASAVAGLDPTQVSIVDGRGTLLTQPDSGDDSLTVLSNSNDERRRRMEDHLRRAVEQLLERTLGAGKVRAEVSAEMDFDRINTSEELYDPDSQVVRSTQSIEETGSSRDAAVDPVVSVATNLPDPSSASGPGRTSATSENRTEETVNYEISKKIVNHVREIGSIKRLSVAVLVDGDAADRPRGSEELEQIATLVRGAIGFDADRGDRVEVINMPFAVPEIADATPSTFLGLGFNEIHRIAQSLFVLLFGLLVLFFVIRPVLNRALDASRPTPEPSADADPVQAEPPMLAAPVADLGEMIDIDRVEGQVKASLVSSVGEIVNKHPDESLAIVRGWLHAGS